MNADPRIHFAASAKPEARAALEKALAAKDRPGRELADQGRRAEATALLQQVTGKLQ